MCVGFYTLAHPDYALYVPHKRYHAPSNGQTACSARTVTNTSTDPRPRLTSTPSQPIPSPTFSPASTSALEEPGWVSPGPEKLPFCSSLPLNAGLHAPEHLFLFPFVSFLLVSPSFFSFPFVVSFFPSFFLTEQTSQKNTNRMVLPGATSLLLFFRQNQKRTLSLAMARMQDLIYYC